MKSLSLRILLLPVAAGFSQLPALADPVAAPDTYSVSEDGLLIVGDDEDVLGNDTPDPGASISAELVTGPSNGRLELNADGTFTYVPNPDFSGTDTFTYVANGEVGAQIFTVDQGNSSVNVDATLSTSFGSDSDSDSSSISGTLDVDLSPPSSPFSTIQVQDVDLTLTDAMSLNFSFAFGLAGVNANTDPNGITVTMDSPGAASAVDGSGNFSQTGNTLHMTGTANVSGSGLAAGQVPEGPQDFDDPVENVDFAGTITQSGSTLTLTIPLTFTGNFPIDGNSLDITISGTVVATAPVATAPPQSAPTTVTINVSPVDDAPVTMPDLYYVGKDGSLAVGAAAGATEVLIGAGSVWSYLDDGSDQGTAWRGYGFDDSGWATGAAELGYGDGDEGTEISDGGDENNVHATYYFRREFTVTDARDVGRLLVRLLRDDGAVVYINGTEVARSNMPAVFDHTTLAAGTVSGTDEVTFFEFEVDASSLYEGTNVIAVEVHQAAVDSSDVSFDLELIRTRAGGLLVNDSDFENDGFSTALSEQSANGTAVVNASGSFVFSPQSGFTGDAEFLYEVNPAGALPVPLLPRGARWKYLDDGSDQGTAWYGSAFDDSSWAKGRAEIGYGDGDEATEVGFGPDSGAKYATTYFRNEFHLSDPLAANISMEMLRDDAAAVYVNGIEIYRDSNLASGAAFNVYATSGVADENAYVSFTVPSAALVSGKNVVAVEVHQSSGTSSDLSFDLAVLADIPQVTLVNNGSVWKYLDDGSDQGTAWQSAAFDDAGWDSGAAVLGYGNGDEATEISFGGDSANKHVTTYFRRTFDVPDADFVNALVLRYVADDGIAVYLNGTPVFRSGLTDTAAFDELAGTTIGGLDEYAFQHVSIDSSALVSGENVLAVEIHQATAGSSDLSFDLELLAVQTDVVQKVTVRVINDDTDNDGMRDDYERAFGLVVGIDDSGADDDGDGRTNLAESIAYTDPFSSASLLKTTAITGAGANLEIQFSAVVGKTYTLEQSTDLITWTPTGGAVLTAASASESFTVSVPAVATYWRVVTTR